MTTKMKTYRGAPYWRRAKTQGVDNNGTRIIQGERVFFFPVTGAVFAGDAARIASEQYDLLTEVEERGSW